MKRISKKATVSRSPTCLDPSKLRDMIEEATVDAHDEAEQVTGWFTMFENHLELPFDTEVLGVTVRVQSIDLRDDRSIVVVCRRGTTKQVIDITELPLPTPRPAGAEWIDAFRQWRRGQ